MATRTAQLEVAAPGSEIVLNVPGGDGVPAVIASVQIRADLSVSYEVAWWNGNSRNTAWVGFHELMGDLKMTRIGFKA